MLRYDELQLRLGRSASGDYVVSVRSPAGSGEGTFHVPFADLEIENSILKMVPRPRGTLGMNTVAQDAAEKLGGALFDALFQGDVDRLYRESRARAKKAGKGLRITFELADAPALASIPWECLFDRRRRDRLALGRNTPIIRKLQVEDPQPVLRIRQPPLRVLGMVSSPRGHEPLDRAEQRERLEDALHELIQDGLVEVEWCETATLRELNRRLARRKFHVFHYCGHGEYNKKAQDGVLVFEGPQGESCPISGLDLGQHLREHGQHLRLAVLSACQGARTSREDPFGGVAAALLWRSMPAVVAMQFDIDVDAAGEFTEHFYNALAEGNQVDTAVTYGRLAINALHPGDVDWATPVLFLQVADGRIFDARWRSTGAPVPTAEVLAARVHTPPEGDAPSCVAAEVMLPQLTGVELTCVQRPGSAASELGTDFHIVVGRAAADGAVVVGQLSAVGADHIDVVAEADGAVRTELATGGDASQLLDAVNGALMRVCSTDGRWSAACARVLTGTTTEVELAWGGPPPAWSPRATRGPDPVVLRGDGSVEAVTATGASTGTRVTLGAADALVLCTQGADGLSASSSQARNAYAARLLERAGRGPEHETATRLATAICEDGRDVERDLSIVVVRPRTVVLPAHVIPLRGCIDLSIVEPLKLKLADAAQGDRTCVLVDMSEVDKLDSKALPYLVSARRRQREAGGDLRVVGDDRLAQMFHLYRVGHLLKVYPSLAAAMAGPPPAR